MFLLRSLARLQNSLVSHTQIRHTSNSTIFALSSGYGRCGVAVIRVSGPEASKALELLTRNPVGKSSKVNERGEIRPRYASLRKLWFPNKDELIDKGLVLWFPGPNSFTGEDCCEFQVHGGTAVVSALCDALNNVGGLRPALAGEFTRRAFRSNKLDLTEVEGLADLIHAETEIQRKQALLQSSGAFSKVYDDWRQRILRSVAFLEAYIDFAEDENIEPETMENVQNDVFQLIVDVRKFLNDGRRGEMRRNGIKTVILGEPNVGKSSFMNHICQKPISIVTNIEGTTRDIVESSFNIAGFPVVIADTAGLRNHTLDPIEREGIDRARNYAAKGDLIILLVEAPKLLHFPINLEEFKRNHLMELGILNDRHVLSKEIIIIANKSDLVDGKSHISSDDSSDVVFISCTENEGIENAVSKLEQSLRKLTDCDEPILTLSPPNDRHRQLLQKTLEQLQKFRNYTKNDVFDFSIAAFHLRDAMHQLESISQRTVDNEKIYDCIFKQFCIGK